MDVDQDTANETTLAMSPQEVQEQLKLNQLKDKIWYVVPSCATTGEGLFEGLVSTDDELSKTSYIVLLTKS